MLGLGLPELIVIFLVVFLLFGAKALPEIARSIGKAFRVFKKETNEIKQGFESDGPKEISRKDEKKV